MRNEKITIDILLDKNNVCDTIQWEATQKPVEGAEKAKAMSLALWDGWETGTVKIDLWTKDMEVHEMKRFCIEIINGLADTIRNATNDEIMAMDMENLCIKMEKRLKSEIEKK